MARKIVITSGKGGVGKTSITATLGICIAKKGYNVAMIDADLGLNNLDVAMGVENKIMFDVCDILENRCTLKQALVQDENIPNLYILPSQRAFALEKITSNIFKSILIKLDAMFEYILIDCPAGIDAGFHRAVCGADEAIIITTPHISAIRDADKVLSILNSYNLNAVNVVVNRLRGDLIFKGLMLSAEQVANVLKRFLIGAIPEDDAISVFSQLGRMDLNSSTSCSAVNNIAEYLVGGKLQIYDPTKKYKNIFYRLFKG